MAAIRPGDIERLVARSGGDYRILLIHGPDEGLARLRVRALAEAILGSNADPTNRVELNSEALNADPGRLADETQGISMFGDRRVIIVRQAGKLAKNIWQALLEKASPVSPVILHADELAKSHALRNACESNPDVAVIACYPLEGRELEQAAQARLHAAGLSVSPQAAKHLTDLIGTDQSLSLQEIDKLALYCLGQSDVTSADIDAILTDTSASSAVEPIDIAFDGDLPGIEPAMYRCLRDGTSAAVVLTLALNHAQTLHRLVRAKSDNMLDQAMKQERLFFRRESRIRRQAQSWSSAGLNRALEILGAAQVQTRTSAALEETIVARALWAVALAARRTGR
jgi:DNA polymerase-3 subunit delta